MKKTRKGLRILFVVQREGNEAYLALPGGGGKRRENQVDATVREWKEETNLSVTVGRLLAVLQRVDRPSTMIIFQIRSAKGKLKPDGKEILDCRWLSLDEIWEHRESIKPHQLKAVYQILNAMRKRKSFPINSRINGGPSRKQWRRIIKALGQDDRALFFLLILF